MKNFLKKHWGYSLVIMIWLLLAGNVAWEEWRGVAHEGDWYVIIASGLFIAAFSLRLEKVQNWMKSNIERLFI